MAMLYSYLYDLTGLKIVISEKTPANHTPEIKREDDGQYITLEE